MNGSAITFIIGWILNIEAALMLPSCAVALLYRERCGWAFAVTMALCLAIGVPRVMMGMKRKVFHARESLVTVSLSWVVLSVMGALPFFLSGTIPSFVDALFETVSGFTTTGASILPAVEGLPRCMLFWRSFTH